MDDSLTLHLDDDGSVDLARTLLHVAIIEELLEGVQPVEEPVIVFVAGGPASGKGRLAHTLELPGNFVRIDVDDVRGRLPEYSKWQLEQPEDAGSLTQREAAQIAKEALAIAFQRRYNIVLDAVGGDDSGKFSSKVRAAIERGFSVRVCYATVSVELALRREEERFARTMRRVPELVLRGKHAEVSRGIENVARLPVESIEVYDMSGERPRLLAHGVGGRGADGLEAVDPDGYAEFLAKGRG